LLDVRLLLVPELFVFGAELGETYLLLLHHLRQDKTRVSMFMVAPDPHTALGTGTRNELPLLDAGGVVDMGTYQCTNMCALPTQALEADRTGHFIFTCHRPSVAHWGTRAEFSVDCSRHADICSRHKLPWPTIASSTTPTTSRRPFGPPTHKAGVVG
jgi:hypothetical protein